jgi:hypothetical protein
MANKIQIFTNKLRFTDKYNEWRIQVLKEQGKKCQLCGSLYRIHVHHIKYFQYVVSEFLNRYNNLDVFKDTEELLDCAEYYNELWDIDNGLILCKECHELEHNIEEE